MRTCRSLAAILLLTLLSACAPTGPLAQDAGSPAEGEPATLVLVNGLLIDGTGADPVPDAVVWIGGTVLRAVTLLVGDTVTEHLSPGGIGRGGSACGVRPVAGRILHR